MPRTLSPAVLQQVLAGQLRPALFVQMAFETETVWLWSGVGMIAAPGPAYDPAATFPYGQSFVGMGWLGQIQSVPEITDVVAQNVTLVLSGIPSELMTDAINAVRQNSVATIWLGMLDSSNAVIGDPVQIFQGHLDVPTSTEGASTCTISITAENPLIDLNRAPSRRYTDVDQQIDFPGDTGFFQVQLLQDFNIVWPSPFGTATQSAAPPNYLTMTPGQNAPVVIRAGQTVQLSCTETRSDGTTQLVLGPGVGGQYGGPVYSSDPSVAKVSATGVVTGVAPGMCTITKRFSQGVFTTRPSNNVTASITVVVTA